MSFKCFIYVIFFNYSYTRSFSHSFQTFVEVTVKFNDYWLEATKDKWSEDN